MENPFKYGVIVRGPYFADRKNEVAELTREMQSLSRVFLVSPRRFGKTCLIFNLLDALHEKGLATAYLDLNAYPDLRIFAAAFAQVTSRALESDTKKLIKIFAGLKKLRPRISLSLDGSISGGLEVAAEEKDALSALLEGMTHAETLARKTKKKLVVVIDEFSDLVKYDGQVLEKAMRSEIQLHSHVGYIFSGSEESVMLSMARDKKRAFYKMGRIMDLGPIDRTSYTEFILEWFEKGRCKIEKEWIEKILDLGKEVPHNIQRLCHALWDLARENIKITDSVVQELPLMIARQDSPHFELLWHTASTQQQNLLIALSRDPEAKPFSRDFQLTHGIGPSSSIKASLDSLVKKNILLRTKEGSYRFHDVFMQYWILSLQE
jgi:AAA+ ATPase superfamily predicted ATPase